MRIAVVGAGSHAADCTGRQQHQADDGEQAAVEFLPLAEDQTDQTEAEESRKCPGCGRRLDGCTETAVDRNIGADAHVDRGDSVGIRSNHCIVEGALRVFGKAGDTSRCEYILVPAVSDEHLEVESDRAGRTGGQRQRGRRGRNQHTRIDDLEGSDGYRGGRIILVARIYRRQPERAIANAVIRCACTGGTRKTGGIECGISLSIHRNRTLVRVGQVSAVIESHGPGRSSNCRTYIRCDGGNAVVLDVGCGRGNAQSWNRQCYAECDRGGYAYGVVGSTSGNTHSLVDRLDRVATAN